jgi:photosystem II stability/assembly factor-like uncharacterized protein
MKVLRIMALGVVLVGAVWLLAAGEQFARPVAAHPGGTWSLENEGIVTSERLSGVSAPDESTVWVTGTGGIYRSVDGGDSYTKVLVDSDQDEILATDANTAWGMANFSIRKTTDGGTSWTTQPVFSWPDKNGICAFDANTLYTVAWEGAIGRTTDGGTSWSTVRGATHSEQFMGDCQAPSPLVAYVVGWKGSSSTTTPHPVVYKTTDGGATWGEVFLGDGIIGGFHDTAMADANTVWAVGGARRSPGIDGPLIARTTDGGATWTTQVLELSDQSMILEDIARSSTGLLLAVGSWGTILASTDDGATWEAEESGTAVHLHKVAVVGETAWAVGHDGTVLKREAVAPPAVGGMMEMQANGSGPAVDSAAGSSDASPFPYQIALATGVAAGAIVVAVGGWYASRRWLR